MSDEEDEGDGESAPYVTWQPRKWPPKRHDHVGHMVFVGDDAACKGCGQQWTLQQPAEAYNKWRYSMARRKFSKNKKRR